MISGQLSTRDFGCGILRFAFDPPDVKSRSHLLVVRGRGRLCCYPAMFLTPRHSGCRRQREWRARLSPWARATNTGSRSSESSPPSDWREYRQGPQSPDSHSRGNVFVRCPSFTSLGLMVWEATSIHRSHAVFVPRPRHPDRAMPATRTTGRPRRRALRG